MPEYGWSRMFQNMPKFSICLSKNKYIWISLEYVIKCQKYNAKRYCKVTLQVLDSIYIKERHIQNSIKRPRCKGVAFEKMFNTVLWIWLWVWTCFVIRNARVLNMSGIHRALNMGEYALEQCSNIFEYVWNRTWNNFKS